MGSSEVEQLQHNPNPTTNTNINKLNENKDTISTENNANGNITVTKKTLSLIQPHSLLPKPTPPISNSHPQSTNPNDVVQLNFKTFFRQRSNDLTSAITRTISSIKNSIDDNSFNDQNDDVKEFKLSGLKVVVTVKNDASLGKVRITLFSRSNCRDCSAVRRFFRERGLKFVEINIDVYTEREKELNQRIGNSNSTVPMIFFNEKLIGGLVELNAMRKNGELEKKLIEIANGGFSGDVPVAPAYGFDEVAEEKVAVEEEIAKVVRVLRQRLPIQDRLMKMKIVRNCFDGSELVELLVRNHGYVHDKVRLFS
jgi:glutaredoxin